MFGQGSSLPLCHPSTRTIMPFIPSESFRTVYITHDQESRGSWGGRPSPPVVIAGLCYPSIPQAPTVTTATLCRRCIGTSHGRKIDSCFTTTCFFDLFGVIYKVQLNHVKPFTWDIYFQLTLSTDMSEQYDLLLVRGTFTQISPNVI